MSGRSQLVMAVEIRPDEDEFLATLALARVGEGGPPLPDPVPADPDWYRFFDEVVSGSFDPLSHAWGEYLSGGAISGPFPGRSGVSLEWLESVERWALTVRSTWQMLTYGTASMIAWMASHVHLHPTENREFVGYIIHEYDPGPTLIWLTHDGFVFDGIDDAEEGRGSEGWPIDVRGTFTEQELGQTPPGWADRGHF